MMFFEEERCFVYDTRHCARRKRIPLVLFGIEAFFLIAYSFAFVGILRGHCLFFYRLNKKWFLARQDIRRNAVFGKQNIAYAVAYIDVRVELQLILEG